MSGGAFGRPLLKLETCKTPAAVTVRCFGRLVSDACQLLQDTVQALIPTTKCLVLDLDNVTFVDSSGLGAVVGLHVFAQNAGCQLKLIHLSPRIRELLKITSLLDVLETREDPLAGT
jgi:anti-sigma B factor antagonist